MLKLKGKSYVMTTASKLFPNFFRYFDKIILPIVLRGQLCRTVNIDFNGMRNQNQVPHDAKLQGGVYKQKGTDPKAIVHNLARGGFAA